MPDILSPNYGKKLLCYCLVYCLAGCSLLFGQGESPSYSPFMFEVETQGITNESARADEEVQKIIRAQESVDKHIYDEVLFWNAAYPSYRWHQIMVEAGNRTKGHKNGGRMAILHLAIYDALAQVWKLKETTNQKAPFEQYSEVVGLVSARSYSAYVCEYSAAAAAAREIISYYFPEQKDFINQEYNKFKDARLMSGLQFPKDIEIGESIGQSIAQKYISYAKTDRTDRVWSGSVPNDPSLWKGTPSPWDPMKRQWKSLTLDSPDQFRPSPPPIDWNADMEELREFNRNNKSSTIAWKWKSEPIWDQLLERKILAYDLDPFEAAYASALFHSGRFDATIAAWDGKYHYWGIRPFQYDSDFEPILIETPNFPGYPAGHTTVAGALATILSHLFPKDAQQFEDLELECSESRFEGGVHFRTDNEVGLVVGSEVGLFVVNNFIK